MNRVWYWSCQPGNSLPDKVNPQVKRPIFRANISNYFTLVLSKLPLSIWLWHTGLGDTSRQQDLRRWCWIKVWADLCCMLHIVINILEKKPACKKLPNFAKLQKKILYCIMQTVRLIFIIYIILHPIGLYDFSHIYYISVSKDLNLRHESKLPVCWVQDLTAGCLSKSLH